MVAVDGKIPPGHIYVGQGTHTTCLQSTKWKCPWVVGVTCTHDEWIPLYVAHIHQNLWQDLAELQGKVLVCDCEDHTLCEADLLAGLVFDATSPALTSQAPPSVPHQRSTCSPIPLRKVLLTAALGVRGLPFAPPFIHQESLALAFKRFYPEHWFRGFAFPFIEDLVNSFPLDLYSRWRFELGYPMEGSSAPHLASSRTRQRQRNAEGQQVGAISHRAALPPLIPFGLSPDEHFLQALEWGGRPLPTEGLPVVDDDLVFAASFTSWPGSALRSLRESALTVLQQLKRRWQPVTKQLRKFQTPAIHQVTVQRDVGFTALLVLLINWSDTLLPHGLVAGLPAVGYSPPCGVFPEQPAHYVRPCEIFEDWQKHNAYILDQLKPGADDIFLLDQSVKDASLGFCSYPMSDQQLLAKVGDAPFRLIPRKVITQSSGKQRIIDDAFVGKQSELSSDGNKLTLCSPLRPAQHIQVALTCAVAEDLASAQWETGGEDWPNAYRYCPMSYADSLACVVVFHHHEWGTPAYQLYSGLLFGLPLAVTSFNRYSRFTEALGRRLNFGMISLYFDDATITDRADCRGSLQSSFGQLQTLLGTPFAAEKQQLMRSGATFLGLEHDLSEVPSRGRVTFWARDRIQKKLLDIIAQARYEQRLPSGTASKLYGVANFFEMGVWGRVGCGGLAAIKARQQEHTGELTPEILHSFEVLEAVISLKPCRHLYVRPLPHPRFIAASDAALEAPGQGSGGFLLVWFQEQVQQREAFVADIPPQVYDLWKPGEHKIAQLELLMVLYGLYARPHAFRHRRGIWFIDNTAALMALIRGRSRNADLEHLATLIHMTLFALDSWFWFEWIPSKSNWADSISRLGASDPWFVDHSFTLHHAHCPFLIWHLPFPALIRVAQFL